MRSITSNIYVIITNMSATEISDRLLKTANKIIASFRIAETSLSDIDYI